MILRTIIEKFMLSYRSKSWRKSSKEDKEKSEKRIIDCIIENNKIKGPEFEERVQNITDIAEAVIVIKKYEEIIRTQKKKIISIVDY